MLYVIVQAIVSSGTAETEATDAHEEWDQRKEKDRFDLTTLAQLLIHSAGEVILRASKPDSDAWNTFCRLETPRTSSFVTTYAFEGIRV